MGKKIWFINPEDTFLEKKGDRAPLGLLYLSSWCKKLGHETRVIDLNHEQFNQKDLFEKPHYICFSVSTPNYKAIIQMAQDIKHFKNKYPRVFNHYLYLIAGGNHVTALPEEKDTKESFDYIIVGEGENGL